MAKSVAIVADSGFGKSTALAKIDAIAVSYTHLRAHET